MRKFSLDKIALHVDALNIVSKFNELQKINDITYVTLWDSVVHEDVIVHNFWGILNDTFKSDGNKYKNCKIEIQYPGGCTSFKIQYVTDHEMMKITAENEKQRATMQLEFEECDKESVDGNLGNTPG